MATESLRRVVTDSDCEPDGGGWSWAGRRTPRRQVGDSSIGSRLWLGTPGSLAIDMPSILPLGRAVVQFHVQVATNRLVGEVGIAGDDRCTDLLGDPHDRCVDAIEVWRRRR